MENADQTPLSSLRAQTRNLLNDDKTPSCSGDGGCSSAMRTRSGRVVHFGEITLPASKSESNRALMIAAYGGFAPDFENLSDSNDTLVLKNTLLSIDALAPSAVRHYMDSNKVFRHVIPSLPPSKGVPEGRGIKASVSMPKNSPQVIDIADCGTAARFLTTYLACHEGDWLLTGTERMKQRPIQPLVNALSVLGADIQYVEKEGCLPLRIHGKALQGGKVKVDMTQSSQFASSLLLAAPMFPQGLEMELVGSPSSLPYLDMTIKMLCRFLAQVKRQGKQVVVRPKPYEKQQLAIESDWSAASYWYEMAAFSEECEIRLLGLNGPSTGSGTLSLQGDIVIAEWMQQLGIGTFFENDAIVLRKIPFEKHPLTFDFSQHPDLYPTMAATCAGIGVEATFTGLDNLSVKESDRVEAMQNELAKKGGDSIRFCAHNDHRIVMALAPLSMLVGTVSFDHPEVVGKSYPNFWDDAAFLPIQR